MKYGDWVGKVPKPMAPADFMFSNYISLLTVFLKLNPKYLVLAHQDGNLFQKYLPQNRTLINTCLHRFCEPFNGQIDK